MKIAVVSDVHGNWTALEAVLEDLETVGADLVVHGGDLAGSGSRPADVLECIADLGWPGVVGNVDELVWAPERLTEIAARQPERQALWSAVTDLAEDTREALGETWSRWLQRLPATWCGHGLTVVHASPDDLSNAPPPAADDGDLERTYGPLRTALVVYGHIHQPFIRRLTGLVVANSGSVSLSYDGDPRASYLVIDRGRPAIRRVEYDIETEVREMAERGCPHVPWLGAMLRAARFVAPG